ncbi:MAG: hypothetical protein ACK5AZ_05230 [Bryobacteraceae bacterium]
MKSICIAALPLLLAGVAAAQPEPDIAFQAGPGLSVTQFTGTPGEPGSVSFIRALDTIEGRTVKGAPYSADAVSETVQRLADGNKIVQKNTSKRYRDGEGRTRNENTLGGIGPWAASGEPKTFVSIHDPVAGVRYMLDPDKKTARKIAMRTDGTPPPPPPLPPPPPGANVAIRILEAPGTTTIRAAGPMEPGARPDVRTEPLGKRVIEGVEAEGTRTVTTIPAGQIGNQQPIEIVSERWFSPQLQTIVLSIHNDPRMGETTFRLTGLRLGEPPPHLFELPPDYTVEEGPMLFQRRLQRK